MGASKVTLTFKEQALTDLRDGALRQLQNAREERDWNLEQGRAEAAERCQARIDAMDKLALAISGLRRGGQLLIISS